MRHPRCGRCARHPSTHDHDRNQAVARRCVDHLGHQRIAGTAVGVGEQHQMPFPPHRRGRRRRAVALDELPRRSDRAHGQPVGEVHRSRSPLRGRPPAHGGRPVPARRRRARTRATGRRPPATRPPPIPTRSRRRLLARPPRVDRERHQQVVEFPHHLRQAGTLPCHHVQAERPAVHREEPLEPGAPLLCPLQARGSRSSAPNSGTPCGA